MKHLFLCITILCLLVVGTSPAHAFRTDSRITAISKTHVSVKIGHATHSYKITSQTLIHLDGTNVHAKSLRKGMHADVTKSQLDPNTASAIEASSGS
jgi:uncharacterized membrane protein YqgA involved in biofilm formation